MKQARPFFALRTIVRAALPIWFAAASAAALDEDPPPTTSAPTFATTEAASTPTPPTASQPADASADTAADADRVRAIRQQRFQLRELSAELGFDTHGEQRSVSSSYRGFFVGGMARQNDREWRFEESLGLHGEGSLFDDHILQYNASVRGGLRQSDFYEWGTGPNREGNPTGGLLEYDARVNLFPAGKLSGDLFASQALDRVPRAFQPSLDRTRERYGGGVYFNDQVLPMRLTYEDEYDQLDSRSHRRNWRQDDEDTRRQTLRYEATWNSSENHALNLSYEYGQNVEKYSGQGTRFDTFRNYLLLDDTLRFGLDNLSRLETIARLDEEAGDLGQDTMEFAPQLHLQHTRDLSTDYKFQYLRQNFDQLDAEQYRGDFDVTYRMADPLTLTGGFYALDRNSATTDRRFGGAADTSEYGANANVAYSQDNKLGHLSASLGDSYNSTEVSDGRRFGLVIGESLTFRDPLSSWLAQRDVQLASVVVTDVTRTRVYLPLRDYVAVRIGAYTALRRVPTGRITDRQTVLVSYSYRVFNDYALKRNRTDFRLQQDFKFGLAAYYALSYQDEDLDRRRYLTWPSRDVNRHRFGLTYKHNDWSVGAEYEINDDDIDPYHAFYLNGDATLMHDAIQTLGINGSLGRFYFTGADYLEAHQTTLADVGLTHRLMLMQNLENNATLRYRYETDSINGVTHGVDLRSGLSYQIGEVALSFELEYEMLDLPHSSDGSLAAWFKLRRGIPIISDRQER